MKYFVFCIKKTTYIVFVILLILILNTKYKILNTVYAQQVHLGISPPLVELIIKPGKSVLVAYTIHNFGDPVVLRPRVTSFEPKDLYGHIKIKEELEGPARFSLDNADLSLTEPFLLKTKETKQLLLRMRIPEGAPDGDYYYTLLVETQPSPGEEGISSSRARAGIGSNILITITGSGQLEVKGKISFFSVIKKWLPLFDSSDKIPVVLIVENAGKNVIKPQGDITLRGNFGEKATYEIIPQNILAESQRQMIASDSAIMENQEEAYTLILSGFFIGHYDLSTNLNLGDGSKFLSASTFFVALPLKFGLIIFITFIIVITIIKRFHNS